MFDVIGRFTIPGEFDDDGNWTLLPRVLSGWRVNTTPEVMVSRPDLEPFVVNPPSLLRDWAGDDPANPTMTIPLRFTDEAEALAVIGAVE